MAILRFLKDTPPYRPVWNRKKFCHGHRQRAHGNQQHVLSPTGPSGTGGPKRITDAAHTRGDSRHGQKGRENSRGLHPVRTAKITIHPFHPSSREASLNVSDKSSLATLFFGMFLKRLNEHRLCVGRPGPPRFSSLREGPSEQACPSHLP